MAELQKKYTDANNINKGIMIIIDKHGLNDEVSEFLSTDNDQFH